MTRQTDQMRAFSRWVPFCICAVFVGLNCSDGESLTQHAGEPGLSVSSGAAQSVTAGSVVPKPITMRVADAAGVPLFGRTVTFAVKSGGGTLTGNVSTTTNASGLATLPASWTFGRSNVPQVLTVTSGSLSIDVTMAVRSSYGVQVIFYGGSTPDPSLQAAFESAARRLSAIIVGGASTETLTATQAAAFNEGINGASSTNGCGAGGGASLPAGSYTGVVIFAKDTSTLGASTIASGGPCIVRDSSQLTFVGIMKFSRALLPTIIARGQMNDVVLHEMTHVVGFNSVQFLIVPDRTNPLGVGVGTLNSAFRGSQAVTACLGLPLAVVSICSPRIPLENIGGAGSVDSHWRESVFVNELMTSVVASDAGTSMPFSTMTVGALGDLGYSVNANAADAYTFGSSGSLSFETWRSLTTSNTSDVRLTEKISVPIGVITKGGRFRRRRKGQS